MSKRRYHRRSKMKRRGVKNGSQNGSKNGSKMAPKWLQNGSLEASGRPLGPTLLPDAPRSRPGEALARPGASPKIHLGGLGTPLERKVDRFRPPGGSPGGSRRGSGRSFGSFLAVGPAGTKKKQKSHQKVYFFGAVFAMRFLTAPVCVLFASALAGAKAQLKNMLKTIGFYDIICVCAVCARSANILLTERTSNHKMSKCKRKTPCHGSSKKSPKKHRFGSQNVSKNRPRRPPGAPWTPPARDFRAKSSPKALLEASRGETKVPKAPLEEISNEIGKKPAIDPELVGGVGAAVKAYPGGFRPGKTRLKSFKHAHHRKRWSAD